MTSTTHRLATVIAPRDWDRMSWHQRERVLNRYALAHRPPDREYAHTPPNPNKCPKCGAWKKRIEAKTCRNCYTIAAAEKFERIVETIAANPEAPATDIARMLGYSEPSPIYRLLRRNGRADLADQIKRNSMTKLSELGMARKVVA